ncbi:MAG: ABC transporter permease [Planctomycetia bacterium]
MGPAGTNPVRERPQAVLTARRGWRGLGLHEIYPWRGLLWALVWRDIRSRYRRAVLGVLWALVRPVATTAVFSLLLGSLAGVDADGQPYVIYAFTGMLAWGFFATAVQAASVSVIGAGSLVTKVYFPRVLIPLASVGSATVDFLVGTLALGALLAWHGVPACPGLALAPLAMLWVALVACGVGILLAGLVALYRDLGHAMAFLMQVWLYLTPVLYPLSLLPGGWRTLACLNPMTGPVEAFRAAVLGVPLDVGCLATSAGVGGMLLCAGLLVFARVERRLADLL